MLSGRRGRYATDMSKQATIGIVVGIAIIIVGFFFLSTFLNLFGMNQQPEQQPVSLSATSSQATNGLVTQDQTVGTGATAEPGDVLTVNYTGKLQDGTVFDSSVGKTPFQFTLGAGQVIPGWDQGLIGMKEGGTRVLVIPPSLGYGSQTVGPIPANSTLVFEVQLIKVQSPASSTTQ